jgi:hypothetical protein
MDSLSKQYQAEKLSATKVCQFSVSAAVSVAIAVSLSLSLCLSVLCLAFVSAAVSVVSLSLCLSVLCLAFVSQAKLIYTSKQYKAEQLSATKVHSEHMFINTYIPRPKLSAYTYTNTQ